MSGDELARLKFIIERWQIAFQAQPTANEHQPVQLPIYELRVLLDAASRSLPQVDERVREMVGRVRQAILDDDPVAAQKGLVEIATEAESTAARLADTEQMRDELLALVTWGSEPMELYQRERWLHEAQSVLARASRAGTGPEEQK